MRIKQNSFFRNGSKKSIRLERFGGDDSTRNNNSSNIGNIKIVSFIMVLFCLFWNYFDLFTIASTTTDLEYNFFVPDEKVSDDTALIQAAAISNKRKSKNYKHNLDSNFEHLSSEQYDELLELLQPSTNISNDKTRKKKVKIYQEGNWDGAPIVLEKYKLVFFTQGKVACTVFKQLMRRMTGTLPDWKKFNGRVPHNPKQNGLRYLYHFYPLDALTILTNPDWTRVIFVRDPKERTLSAFLDKAGLSDGKYIKQQCCHNNNTCSLTATGSFLGFLKVVDEICCCDHHWEPQSKRIDRQFRPFINVIGNFDTLQYDTKSMLDTLSANMNNNNKKSNYNNNSNIKSKSNITLPSSSSSDNIDLWNQFGSNGWGDNEQNNNLPIFAAGTSAKHKTSASDKLSEYYNDTNVVSLFKKLYQTDYDDTLLNFSSLSKSLLTISSSGL